MPSPIPPPMPPAPTPEARLQAIATLRTVTSVSSDEEAIRLLEASSWNLDRAASAYLDHPRRPRWLMFLFSPLQFLWSFLSNLSNQILLFLGGPARQIEAAPGITPHQRFLNFYRARHGDTHPPFFDGSYLAALSAANQQIKFLLVYIHSESHRLTPQFCAEILSNPTFLSAATPFLPWAGSITQREAAAAYNALRAPALPFLAVVAPPSTTSSDLARANFGTVLAIRAGPPALVGGADGAAAWLGRVLERHTPMLDAVRNQRMERENNRLLIQQQNEDYAAALLADKQAEAAVVAERQRVEKEKNRLEELEIRRQRKRDALGEEPDKGAGIASVVLRLPDGSRVGRRFAKDDALEGVFDWAEVNRVDIEVACLVVSYPRRRLRYPEDAGITLEAAGLFPSAMLLLEERED